LKTTSNTSFELTNGSPFRSNRMNTQTKCTLIKISMDNTEQSPENSDATKKIPQDIIISVKKIMIVIKELEFWPQLPMILSMRLLFLTQ